jgi:S1-C subfamily serine protease
MRTLLRRLVAATTVAVLFAGPHAARADGSSPAAWKAFLDAAFALAPTDFAAVRGAPVANLANRFATTFAPDPTFARNCVIERFPQSWNLDCELTGYPSDPVQAARDAAAALGPAFAGSNLSLASMYHVFLQRPADYFDVSIVRDFTNDPAHVWVSQSVHVQSVAPDGVPSVPILADTSTTAQPREQIVGTGTVVARDATGSYVLAVILNGADKSIEAGSHIGPGHWQLRPATLVAREPDSQLALLRVEPPLNTLPAVFGSGASLGAPARYVVFRDCFPDAPTDLACDAISSPVSIAAQRANGAELEFQGGGQDWPGAKLLDAGGNVVGIANGSLATAVGANVAFAVPALQRFLAQRDVAVATRPSAVAKPPPEIAALLPSVVRVQTADEDGTGVVVRGNGGTPIVLTAAHVVGRLRFAYVYTASGERREARVLRADAGHDLAALDVSGPLGPALGLAPGLRRGMRILTIGYPRSSYQFAGPVTPKYDDGLVGSLDAADGLIAYSVPTDLGNSGGALFDPSTHTVAGIVRGEYGIGGFVGIDVATIRRFIASAAGSVVTRALAAAVLALALGAAARTPARANIPEAAIARAERSIVLVECTLGAKTARLTGVVLLSQAARSYVAVTELYGCSAPRVRLDGDMSAAPLPAQVVPVDRKAIQSDALQAANFSDGMFVQSAASRILDVGSVLLAIDRGGLTAVPFKQPARGPASLFSLNYADSVFAMQPNAKHVEPRLDPVDTTDACSNFSFSAAAQLGLGAPLFAADGTLVAITSSRQPNASDLDDRLLPAARQNYFADNLFDWIVLLHYAGGTGVAIPAWRC